MFRIIGYNDNHLPLEKDFHIAKQKILSGKEVAIPIPISKLEQACHLLKKSIFPQFRSLLTIVLI